MKRLIVARYREDVGWLDAVSEKWQLAVVQKDDEVKGHLPNQGREPSSYLWAILQMYGMIEPHDIFAFVQGNPFDHAGDVVDQLNRNIQGFRAFQGGPNILITYGDGKKEVCELPLDCDANGKPHHEGIPVGEWYERWFDKDFPGEVKFWPGGQFMCTGKEILQHSAEWYRAVFTDLMEHDQAPYAFERLAPTIFSSTRKDS